MNNLVYYPGFEISDSKWLKFALLYIESLRLIVPESGEQYISPFFQRVQEETDLIRYYRPTYDHSYTASLDTLELIEKILEHPERYFPTFHRLNLLDRWRTVMSKIVLYLGRNILISLNNIVWIVRLAMKVLMGLKFQAY